MAQLSIPNPCNEDWAKMTPDGKGRFCTSCAKIVVDFTRMGDEEIKNYFLQHTGQKTCGRFLSTQLNRPLENQAVIINAVWYGKLPFARQVFYAVALFFVLGVSSCELSGTREKNVASDSILIKTEHTIGFTPPEIDTSGLNKIDTLPPPKVEMINHPGPILTGDVATGVPEPEVTQGAPLWQEPIEIDTVKEMMGKIALPPQPKIDTVKPPEPMIMGGIALPIQNQQIENKKNHAK